MEEFDYVSCKFIYGLIFSCSDGHLIMALLECFQNSSGLLQN